MASDPVIDRFEPRQDLRLVVVKQPGINGSRRWKTTVKLQAGRVLIRTRKPAPQKQQLWLVRPSCEVLVAHC